MNKELTEIISELRQQEPHRVYTYDDGSVIITRETEKDNTKYRLVTAFNPSGNSSLPKPYGYEEIEVSIGTEIVDDLIISTTLK